MAIVNVTRMWSRSQLTQVKTLLNRTLAFYSSKSIHGLYSNHRLAFTNQSALLKRNLVLLASKEDVDPKRLRAPIKAASRPYAPGLPSPNYVNAVMTECINNFRANNGKVVWEEFKNQLTSLNLTNLNAFNYEAQLIYCFLLFPKLPLTQNSPLITIEEYEHMLEQFNDHLEETHMEKIETSSILSALYATIATRSIKYSDTNKQDAEFLQLREKRAAIIRNLWNKTLARYENSPLRVPFTILPSFIAALAASSKENCEIAIQVVTNHLDEEPDRHIILWEKTMNRDDFFPQLVRSGLNYGLIQQSTEVLKRLNNYMVTDDMVDVCLRYMLSREKSLPEHEFTFFLGRIQKGQIILSRKHEENFLKLLKNNGWTTFKSRVKDSGKCASCFKKLRGLSKEEVSGLAKSVQKEIMKTGANLYMHSSPQEYAKFEQFLQDVTRKRPIDLVIDGLNIGYKFSTRYIKPTAASGPQKFSRHVDRSSCAQSLINTIVLNDLTDKYRNIVIIGKKHLMSWDGIRNFFTRFQHRISFFLTDNQTNDDAYMLVAAVQNPNTLLLTTDMLRDAQNALSLKSSNIGYSAYISPKPEKLPVTAFDERDFVRWCKTHQICLKETRKLVYPAPYEKRLQFDGDSIHIPFVNADVSSQTLHTEEKLMKYVDEPQDEFLIYNNAADEVDYWICALKDPQSRGLNNFDNSSQSQE